MSKTKQNLRLEEKTLIICYKCNYKYIKSNIKYCPNCNTILKPNELEWRNSFILCLVLLCITPILIALIFVLV